MSQARMEKLLNGSKIDYVPVPRKPIKGIREDTLSKRLRRLDNLTITHPFPNQSGVYINTNENGAGATARELAMFPMVAQAFHIGFSGWHNFDIIAQRHSARAVICDINPENALFFHYSLKYLRLCENRAQFIELMTQFVQKNHYEGARTNTDRPKCLGAIELKNIKFSFNVSEDYPEHHSVTEEIALDRTRETSWLYTDERYAHLRQMALEDKIVLLTENICDSDIFDSIRRLLHDNSMQIDTVYVSNISEWMLTNEQQSGFLQTMQHLLADIETILIDAKQNRDIEEHSSPYQRSISKRQLQDKTALRNWFFSPKAPVIQEKSSDFLEKLVASGT